MKVETGLVRKFWWGCQYVRYFGMKLTCCFICGTRRIIGCVAWGIIGAWCRVLNVWVVEVYLQQRLCGHHTLGLMECHRRWPRHERARQGCALHALWQMNASIEYAISGRGRGSLILDLLAVPGILRFFILQVIAGLWCMYRYATVVKFKNKIDLSNARFWVWHETT